MVRLLSRRRDLESEKPARQSALASRDAFVREVAATIAQRHGKGTESFVFGLSGRWGEGKSFFLEQLRYELKDQGFEVIDLNPWKYAADRVAFLRSFLLRLLDTQRLHQRLASAGRALTDPGRLSRRVNRAWAALDPLGAVTRRRLRVDVSRQSISWTRLVLLAPVFYWLFSLLSSDVGGDTQPWRRWLAAVPAGLAIWLVQGLVASQVSTKAATALDDFDTITSAALGVRSDQGQGRTAVRKVVVLVDDLDRVTARVARDVLDNLRTFFDKADLTFVVTGDHEVLEANLGAELASPEALPEERKELGRLFLKKIFNVYWRLPLPVPSEFQRFVDARLKEVQSELGTLIPDENDRVRLRDWLLLYTDYNLRQVERMLDTVLFSLRLVNAQRGVTSDSQQQRVLTQMCEEPLLLARVLFIQDRCAPFFELLTVNAELLYELDVAVHEARAKGGAASREVVTELLKGFEGANSGTKILRLTDAQRAFLTDFVYEPPSFHDPDRGGKYVPGLAPWIHLACDAGLRDSAGPRPEDMLRAIENRNREGLAAQLATCSETRAEEVTSKVVEGLVADGDVNQRHERVMLVLQELASASPDAPLARELADSLSARLTELLAGASDDQRVSLLLALASVLCVQGFDAIPEDIEQQFAFRGFGDFGRIGQTELDVLQSLVVISWLRSAYEQNQADAISHIEQLAQNLSSEPSPRAALEALMARLREDLLADGSNDRRTSRLQLLNRYGRTELQSLKEAVLPRVQDQAVWQWAVDVVEIAPWTLEELENALLDAISAVAKDPQRLLNLLTYALGKLETRSEDLWTRVAGAREDELLGLVEHLAGRSDFAPLALPSQVSARLYEDWAHSVFDKASQDESAAAASARFLDPNVWLWFAVDKHVMWKALGPLADKRRRFAQLRAVARPYRESLYAD